MPHESAGTLEDALTAAGLTFRYVDLFEKIPADAELDLTAAPGLVVMGGPMNVDETDKYPFLAAEIKWIRQAIAARTADCWAFASARNCWPRRPGPRFLPIA